MNLEQLRAARAAKVAAMQALLDGANGA